MLPSLPQVMNHIELTGENDTELTGNKMILFGFYSILCDLNVMIDF